MNILCNSLFFIALIGISEISLSQQMAEQKVNDSQSTNPIPYIGQNKTSKQALGKFNKVSINAMVDIEYIASQKNGIEVTSDDSDIPLVTSTIKNKTLSIDVDKSSLILSKLSAKIYGPAALQKITAEQSSYINLKGVKSDFLEINLSGASHVAAKGKVETLVIKTSDSSDADTKEVMADNVTIISESTSDTLVTAKKNLDVKIIGISDITYYGHPVSINKTIDGIGKLSAGD